MIYLHGKRKYWLQQEELASSSRSSNSSSNSSSSISMVALAAVAAAATAAAATTAVAAKAAEAAAAEGQQQQQQQRKGKSSESFYPIIFSRERENLLLTLQLIFRKFEQKTFWQKCCTNPMFYIFKSQAQTQSYSCHFVCPSQLSRFFCSATR